jgi:hypothetical protein
MRDALKAFFNSFLRRRLLSRPASLRSFTPTSTRERPFFKDGRFLAEQE